jgi:hypothetical protein
MSTFRRGDFVLLNKATVTTVGMVVRVHPEKPQSIEVWWYERTRPDGSAQIVDMVNNPSELRLATPNDSIQDAMHRLRTENL